MNDNTIGLIAVAVTTVANLGLAIVAALKAHAAEKAARHATAMAEKVGNVLEKK